MRSQIALLVFYGTLVSTNPIAVPTVQDQELDSRDLIGDVLNNLNSIAGDPVESILSDFKLVTATAAPIAVSAASRSLSDIVAATPTPSNLVALAGNLVAAGLTTSNAETALDFVDGVLSNENSFDNTNLRVPNPAAYPKANVKDAPFSLSEAQLRAAIHIPSSFQYGRRGAPQPIILVPGTGDTGYTTFVGNYIPLLQNSNIADPVWLNIPGFLNDDAQVNSEYVAYAINYIFGVSQQRKIAVATWSQGGIDTQWAVKYWPSTRSKVTDLVAFSPDYKGTVLANFIEIGEPLPAAIFQQNYFSKFITALRSNGGDSAYVPTTNVYSGFFDEIVEPQQGINASAFLLDARGVGVSNNEVQSICPGQPAGSFYTHEGVLYNPIGYALLVDALSHNGPGKVSRLDLGSNCGDYLTPGLDLNDLLLTENSILIAGATILLHQNKVTQEPPIKAYARSS